MTLAGEVAFGVVDLAHRPAAASALVAEVWRDNKQNFGLGSVFGDTSAAVAGYRLLGSGRSGGYYNFGRTLLPASLKIGICLPF